MDYFDYNQAFDVKSFLEKSRKRQQERIDRELQRIEEQLEQRESLHTESIDELESKLDWYIERLEDLYRRSFDTSEEAEKVKDRIEEFYREIRIEKRKRWQDRQKLQRERRELLRERSQVDLDEWVEELL